MQFTGVPVEFQFVGILVLNGEEAAAEEAALNVSDFGSECEVIVESLEVDGEVGVESFGFGSDSGDLEIIERGDEVSEFVGIDFEVGVVESVEFPFVGGIFPREGIGVLVDGFSLSFIERVVIDDEVSDVVALDIEEVGFDPVGELGREVQLAFGDVDFIFLGVADVVPIGAVVAGFIFDLFPEDVVDQRGALCVSECDSSSESFVEAAGIGGVEHTVFFVIAVCPEVVSFGEVSSFDSIE